MSLTIKGKLFISYSIILLMLILKALFMINKFSESNNRFLNVVDVSTRKVNLSNELLIAILNESRQEKNLILVTEQTEIIYFNDRLNQSIDSADRKIAELEVLLNEDGRKKLDKIKSIWTQYNPELPKLVSFAKKTEREKAAAISIEAGLKMRDVVLAETEAFITMNKKEMEADKIDNHNAYTTASTLIFSLIAASFIIALILSYWIITSITKRISFIAKEAEKISSRENTNDKLEDP